MTRETRAPATSPGNRFWRIPALDNLELSYASYTRYAFPRHSHEEYIVGVMVEGAERLEHRGSVHSAPVGSVLLMNCGEPHANYSVGELGFAYRTFYPSLELLRRAASDISGDERSSVRFRDAVVDDVETARLLVRVHREFEHSSSAIEQESLFLSAMAKLIERHAGMCPLDLMRRLEKHHVARVREYLDANFMRNVSLSELSALVGISPYYLLRTFRNSVGLSPFEYLIHLRILAAKRMLRRGCPIVRVALATGFADQSHFTRQFKRIVGFTPGQFAEKCNIVQDALPRTD
jgi:AraC-like DNA-binding protein